MVLFKRRLFMEIQRETLVEQSDFNRVWALFEEIGKRFQDTERILSERFQDLEARFKDTERILSERSQETDARVKETSKQIGKLTNNWGEFVEGIVKPSVIKMFKERNIDIERVNSRSTSHKGGDTLEIDLVGDNGFYVVAIEVKTKLLCENVIDFINKLERIKYFFPYYANKRVVGAVAGIIVDDSVKNLAEKKGLFVIMQKGETVEIVNDADFKYNVW